MAGVIKAASETMTVGSEPRVTSGGVHQRLLYRGGVVRLGRVMLQQVSLIHTILKMSVAILEADKT